MPERALKIAVVVMGVLIVLGLAVIVVTIAKRAAPGKVSEQALSEASPAGARPPGAPMSGFGDVLVSIPRGGRMVDFRVEGDRLIIHARPPGLDDVIHVIDLGTGKTLGTVTVAPRPQ
jgi:hypothetical protein